MLDIVDIRISFFREAEYMRTTANRWGSALGIRLTKPVLEKFSIDENTILELDVDQDRIIVTRAKIRPRTTIEELFKDFDGEYEMTDEMKEWEQMKPVGREIL
jgi:antitoxin component of MazEF toxin-antitoxin module